MKTVTIELRELRALKRELSQRRRRSVEDLNALGNERSAHLRARARIETLTREIESWQRRFDALLARTPEVKP